jgi:hypothetical protein
VELAETRADRLAQGNVFKRVQEIATDINTIHAMTTFKSSGGGMDGTSAPSSGVVIMHLKRVAIFHDSLGHDLQAADIYSAIRSLEKTRLLQAGSDDAKHLDKLLEEVDDFLDAQECPFFAKEVREIRIALDQ